jgi:hypothetical protein
LFTFILSVQEPAGSWRRLMLVSAWCAHI